MPITKEIVNSFNTFLKKCDTSFRLVVVDMKDDWVKRLSSFADDSGDCHPVGEYDIIQYAFVAVEKDSNEIASYVSFSVLNGTLSKMPNVKSFVREYIDTNGDVDINSIILEFSCTHPKYRRRGLSVLLRLLIITFAIQEGFDAVLSATNEQSGSLLRDKFGFEVKEEDDMDYLNSYFIPELYLSNGVLINAKLILQSQYLEKYRDIYSNLQKCSITKN